MRPITRDEVLPIGEYETIRPHFRQRIITEKLHRRLQVGQYISVVFENRDTALYQIQEMLRTERITKEPAIVHEIDTYNELVPGDSQLSITLFVEIAERELRERMLVELAGLEHTIALEVDNERFAAHGDFAGVLPGRTTAVHYLKFDLSAAAKARIMAKTAKVTILVEHPQHPARSECSAKTVESLASDLSE